MSKKELHKELESFMEAFAKTHVEKVGETVSNQYKVIEQEIKAIREDIRKMDTRYFSIAILIALVFVIILAGNLLNFL